MTEKNDQPINIVLAAHSGAGKTSLSEIILFKAGITNRIGRIEDGNTVMDFEPEELTRKLTLSSSLCQFSWKKNIINLIDTPGDYNFISDTKLCMQASDAVIMVIDAVDGVKVQTETVWEFITDFELPCIILINKLDKDRSSFANSVKNIKNTLPTSVPVVLQIPIIKNDTLKGIIDLVSKKAYGYNENGLLVNLDIPTELYEQVDTHREILIEHIVETDEKLIELYLEGVEISTVDIKNGLRKAIQSRSLVPILCGSAITDFGIDLLMDFIISVLPSKTLLKKKQGIDPDTNKEIERNPSPKEPFSAFVFKTISDPYAGQLSLFKVVSGTLECDDIFYNSSRSTKERFSQLLTLVGKEQKQAEFAAPGSIVAVAKLKETKTGDTLCDSSKKIIYTCADPLPPLISFAISAKNKEDEDKVYISLSKLLEDDPSLKLERNSETKEILISGLGQIHIETSIEKLKRKYNVEIILKTPKIPYRETIKKKVRVQGKHKKQSGGHGQFGDCWITVEPMPRGSGFEFVNAIVGGAIPRQYIPAVEKGIIEASQKGVLTGFPCVDFRAICDFGSYHAVDSSEMAFKIAGSIAYKKACEEAQPVILEPTMKVTITAPEEFTGDIMGDLNSRRGRVLGVENNTDKKQVINAEVPLAEIQTYAPDLRSITAGRGTYLMEFCRYDEVPSNLSDKVIKKIKNYNNEK